MLSIKFLLNLTYGFVGDVVRRISRWPSYGGHFRIQNGTILAILNLSVAPMPSIVSVKSDIWFGRRYRLKNFKMAVMVRFKQFWISLSLLCLPPSFGSIRLSVWEEISFQEFQDGHHSGHLGYRNGMILAILNLHVATMHPLLSFSAIQLMVLEEMSKMWKANDRRRTDEMTIEHGLCVDIWWSVTLLWSGWGNASFFFFFFFVHFPLWPESRVSNLLINNIQWQWYHSSYQWMDQLLTRY